jgi:hypothetical protein
MSDIFLSESSHGLEGKRRGWEIAQREETILTVIFLGEGVGLRHVKLMIVSQGCHVHPLWKQPRCVY